MTIGNIWLSTTSDFRKHMIIYQQQTTIGNTFVINQYLPVLYIFFTYKYPIGTLWNVPVYLVFLAVVNISGHGVSYSMYWSVLFYCLITSFKLPYCRPGRQWPRCLPDRYEQLRFWVTLFPTRCKLNYFILFQFNYGSVFLHCCGVYINYFLILFDLLVVRGRAVKHRCLLARCPVWSRVESVCFLLGYKYMIYLYICRVVRCTGIFFA